MIGSQEIETYEGNSRYGTESDELIPILLRNLRHLSLRTRLLQQSNGTHPLLGPCIYS